MLRQECRSHSAALRSQLNIGRWFLSCHKQSANWGIGRTPDDRYDQETEVIR